MSTSDAILLAAICVGFALFVTGIAIWQRKSFENRDLSRYKDGPDPELAEDAPFRDGAFNYRVTALPVRDPVWLFRPDGGLTGSSTAGSDSLVAALLAPIVAAALLGLIRLLVASSDRRWKVVIDRKDKPTLAIFHAVSVEVFNSEAEAEARRNEIVRGWLPNWKYATLPRLSRTDVRAVREAAPAYVPDPDTRKPPLSRQARARRRFLAATVAVVGLAFTLFWVVGGIEIAAEGVSGSGNIVEYVFTLVVCLVFALIGIAVVRGGWRLRPGRR